MADSEKIEFPPQVPVFPLPNVVLFPHMDLPLYIFEPRYSKMLDDVLSGDHFMAISLIKEGWENKKEPYPMNDVVGVGMVKFATKNEDGTSTIILGGLARAKLKETLQKEPYIIRKFEVLSDIVQDSNEEMALSERVKDLFIQKEKMTKIVTQDHIENVHQIQDPGRLSDIITFFSTASFPEKQAVLETLNIADRLRRVIRILESEIQRLESKN